MTKRVCIMLVVFLMASVAIAQDVPTVQDLNVDDELAEIDSTMSSIPDTLDDGIIPDETATQLFSYMKWLFSDTSANELLGATLAPILINFYVLLVIAFTFTAMWLTIRALVLAWRLVLFIIEWIIRILELIPFVQ